MIVRNALRPILLHTARMQNISFLKKQITTGSIYRAVGIVASIQLASTFIGTYWIDRNLTLTLSDYFENQFIKENQKFQIVGFIKEGSISIKRGSLETKFILTDYDKEYEINILILVYRVTVYFRGQSKFEFKEGETLVLTGYVPNLQNKQKIIGVEYMTKHSMDGAVWQDKIGVQRQNYGLNNKINVLN